MITDEQKEKSNQQRIEILREGYGDTHPEVKAHDEAHPKAENKVSGAADRLTSEEVFVATETVPAAGEIDSNSATVRAEPKTRK